MHHGENLCGNLVLDPLVRLVQNTLKLEYVSSIVNVTCLPGQEREWKVLPYTAIVVMAEGEAVYTGEIKGTGTMALKAGGVLVLPAGEVFRFTLNEKAVLSYLCVSFTVLENIDVFSFLEFPWLLEGTAAEEIIPAIYEWMQWEKQRQDQKENGTDALICVLKQKQAALRMLELFFSLGKIHKDLGKRWGDIHRIEPVLNYINQHLAQSMERETLARIANLSETRFHYVFEEITGISPMKYVRIQRLQKAQKLLLTSNMSIGEVAESVGFENLPNFCRSFKKYYHITPKQYRKAREYNSFSGQTELPE